MLGMFKQQNLLNVTYPTQKADYNRESRVCNSSPGFSLPHSPISKTLINTISETNLPLN